MIYLWLQQTTAIAHRAVGWLTLRAAREKSAGWIGGMPDRWRVGGRGVCCGGQRQDSGRALPLLSQILYPTQRRCSRLTRSPARTRPYGAVGVPHVFRLTNLYCFHIYLYISAVLLTFMFNGRDISHRRQRSKKCVPFDCDHWIPLIFSIAKGW